MQVSGSFPSHKVAASKRGGTSCMCKTGSLSRGAGTAKARKSRSCTSDLGTCDLGTEQRHPIFREAGPPPKIFVSCGKLAVCALEINEAGGRRGEARRGEHGMSGLALSLQSRGGLLHSWLTKRTVDGPNAPSILFRRTESTHVQNSMYIQDQFGHPTDESDVVDHKFELASHADIGCHTIADLVSL